MRSAARRFHVTGALYLFVLLGIAPASPSLTATSQPTTTPSPSPTCSHVITHSTSSTITKGNSVSCNNGTGHTDNSYWRAFNMQTFAGGAAYFVTDVFFAVESANNTQPVTVRLYKNNGAAFPAGTLTQIATDTMTVSSAQSGTVVRSPITVTVSAGTGELVMELFTPDGQAEGNLFFVGSNTAPQTGPSYISAADCGVTTPTDVAELGFPNMHIVFTMFGVCFPTPTPTATVTPTTTATPTTTVTPKPSPPSLIVTNTNDSGPGSLRQVLADAVDGDTVQFDPALNGHTITLTSGELVINKDITINGLGSDMLRISRSPSPDDFRIIHIMPSHTVAILGLTISNGRMGKFSPANGAGIYNELGTLTVDSCTFSSNFAYYDGGGIANTGTLTVSHSRFTDNFGGFVGGAIYNSETGTLTITSSMVSNNRSGFGGIGTDTGHGGGIYNGGMAVIDSSTIDHNTADAGDQGSRGGGIYNSSVGSLAIGNSTISQNSAVNDGGAIFGGGTITNCTITGNTASQGGGIYVTSALQIRNTILNAGAKGTNILNSGGTVTSHGYNVSSDDGGGFLHAPGDQTHTNPILGPLQDNGGPTFTHELLPGSPAINTGDPSFTPPPLYDQRGLGYDRVFAGRLDIGSFEVQSILPTPTPMPMPARPLNLSTRLRVLTDSNVGIGGFIITGFAQKTVLLRAIGPSLGNFGIPDPLADPVMDLYDLNGLLASNDNWRDTQQAAIKATGIPPTNDLESAILVTLDPAAYTAVVRDKNNSIGVGLVEVYDFGPANSKLANISTRGFVDTGDNVMIGGFILGGDTLNSAIVIRGIGPSLFQSGVPNPLLDPTLELRDTNGVLILANDNWQDDPSQAAQLTAQGLAPQNPAESGIYVELQPSLYTAILAGKNSGTGVGLVEIYNVQN